METARASAEQLAIMLQRAKTFMETSGIQERYWDVYERLSHTIYAFEKEAKVSAPALRDREDGY